MAVAPGLVGTCTVTVSPGLTFSWYSDEALDSDMNCLAAFGLHQSAAGARADLSHWLFFVGVADGVLVVDRSSLGNSVYIKRYAFTSKLTTLN